MKKKTIFLVVLALIITGCDKPAQETKQSSNTNIPVDFLFEHEGIRVYRFNDCGYNIYFTNKVGETQYDTGGKNSQKIQVEQN